VLRAAQELLDEGLAKPILVGRPEVISIRIKRLGLRIQPGRDFELINPQEDSRFDSYSATYHRLLGRHGISPRAARNTVRTNPTVIAALALYLGDADAMIAGVVGRYRRHLEIISQVIGKAEGVADLSALTLMILKEGTYFLADTHVTYDPSAEDLVEMTLMSAKVVRRFGMDPKVAMVSHSNFGTTNYDSAVKVRKAVESLHAQHPDLEVEGEMHADAALDDGVRGYILPEAKLKGAANLLIFPSLDSANIAFSLLKTVVNGISVGPMLIGTAAPAHVLTSAVTTRGIVNMSAVAVVDAQGQSADEG
jgi:malate dehydrogenase (oxaloacetate-decarboxylating)(NADP+)